MIEPTKKFKIRFVIPNDVKEYDEPNGCIAQIFSDFKFIENNFSDMPCENVPNEPGIYEAMMHFYWVDEEEWYFELHDIEDISHPERYGKYAKFDEDGYEGYVIDKYDNVYIFSAYDGRWHPDPGKMERQNVLQGQMIRDFEKRVVDLEEFIDEIKPHCNPHLFDKYYPKLPKDAPAIEEDTAVTTEEIEKANEWWNNITGWARVQIYSDKRPRPWRTKSKDKVEKEEE